jgi:hypothetical protein
MHRLKMALNVMQTLSRSHQHLIWRKIKANNSSPIACPVRLLGRREDSYLLFAVLVPPNLLEFYVQLAEYRFVNCTLISVVMGRVLTKF